MRAYLIGEDLWNGQGYLDALDFSNPSEPRRVGRYSGDRNSWNARLDVSGNYVFVAGEYGVEVIDVSDPARMSRVGGTYVDYGFPGRPIVEDFVVRQGVSFVSLGEYGLAVYQMPPFIKTIAKEGPNVKLEWEGFGWARLQRATRLANPVWLDLPGFEGTNTATLPSINGAEFFRLVRP
jgi:hypothetical protein